MVLFYGAMLLLFAVLTAIRVPHVESLADRKVKPRVLALRDRPFLTLAMLDGLLALCWGMLDSGVPLWITHHTRAHLTDHQRAHGLSAVVTVLFQNRVNMKGARRSRGRCAWRCGPGWPWPCPAPCSPRRTTVPGWSCRPCS